LLKIIESLIIGMFISYDR